MPRESVVILQLFMRVWAGRSGRALRASTPQPLSVAALPRAGARLAPGAATPVDAAPSARPVGGPLRPAALARACQSRPWSIASGGRWQHWTALHAVSGFSGWPDWARLWAGPSTHSKRRCLSAAKKRWSHSDKTVVAGPGLGGVGPRVGQSPTCCDSTVR